MADNSMTFSNTLMQLGGEDFLRELTEFMLNRIMEADVSQRINAEPHERSDERKTYRNSVRISTDRMQLFLAIVHGLEIQKRSIESPNHEL